MFFLFPTTHHCRLHNAHVPRKLRTFAVCEGTHTHSRICQMLRWSAVAALSPLHGVEVASPRRDHNNAPLSETSGATGHFRSHFIGDGVLWIASLVVIPENTVRSMEWPFEIWILWIMHPERNYFYELCMNYLPHLPQSLKQTKFGNCWTSDTFDSDLNVRLWIWSTQCLSEIVIAVDLDCLTGYQIRPCRGYAKSFMHLDPSTAHWPEFRAVQDSPL